MDFDMIRKIVAGTKERYFNRGLDQWSHDELILTDKIIVVSRSNVFSTNKNNNSM